MSTAAAPTVSAAYGLRIDCAEATPWLCARGAEHWPLLMLESTEQEEPCVDADALRASIPAETEIDELVHPMLSSLAGLVALRRGRDALHAGAVCGTDGVWAIVAPKEAGKTTLLAACAAEGLSVFTDDVLVLDGDRAYAGPRCLDLREDAARDYRDTQSVRPQTPRRRLTLPPIEAEQPLAGFVYLAWGEPVELERLTVTAALGRLAAAYAAGGVTSDRVRLLEMAGLPAFELRRPRKLTALGETVTLLRDELGLR